MTAVEMYELITHGGTTELARLFAICESLGPYCVIGGLAVDCYVEPVYTLDVELVVIDANRRALVERTQQVNATAPGSDLRIQFTTDERYQSFPERARDAQILGVHTKVACLEDVTQGKLWAFGDPGRRLSKRKKDELDLIRLAEAYPALKSLYPRELREQLERG